MILQLQVQKLINKGRIPRRGQMFILTSLLMVVYAVAIIAVLSEIQVTQNTEQDSAKLTEYYLDFIEETENFQNVILANITSSTPWADAGEAQGAATNNISNYFQSYDQYIEKTGIITEIKHLETIYSDDIDIGNSGAFNTKMEINITSYFEIDMYSTKTGASLSVNTSVFQGYLLEYSDPVWSLTKVDRSGNIVEFISGAFIEVDGTEYYIEGLNGEYDFTPIAAYDETTDNLVFVLPNGITIWN